MSFPGSAVKNLPANTGDAGEAGLIPGSRRSPGKGNGNPLQYSCLGSPMDREDAGYSPLGSKRVRHDLATKQQQYQNKNACSEQSTVCSGTSMLVDCSDFVGQCNCKCFTKGIFSALSSDLYYTHTTCTHMCIYIFSFQILAQA